MTNWKNFDVFNPTPEHQLLRKSIRQFVIQEVEPQALGFDQKESFNLPLFKKLGPLGLLALTSGEGMGMDAIASVIAHEELSYSDPGFCLAYLAHAVLCVHNISQNATKEQQQKWLPKLSSGEWVGAMAMSEPDVGTDVLAMSTTSYKEGDYYILNGRKMWITNGTISDDGELVDACLVYARKKDSKDITLFFVEKGFSGFSAGQKIKGKTGMRASNTSELIFDNCKVPASHLIGEEGKALYPMMKNLEIERLTLAAMSLGIGRRAFDEMNKYASQRQAFGQKIRQFGQIQKYLAQSYAELNSCRSYVYLTALQTQFGKTQQRLNSDSSKLLASQIGKNIADRAIQVLGGYGYVGEYVVERLWRDAKLLEIGGGTIEALEKNIAKELSL
ncbi:MAG: acyl-CoA dehydrogenase family protein [Bdellovibrionales bacterium]|nr:acyl-CoA dehydrogenase family protein [Bdellovibrionales bacterium]